MDRVMVAVDAGTPPAPPSPGTSPPPKYRRRARRPQLGRARGGALVLRSQARRASVRLDGRSVVVTLVVLVAGLAVFAWSLTLGDFLLPVGEVLASLVGHPHQRWFRQWSTTDEEAVAEALAATEITDLADRLVDELSGGQRQRVWIALALAQGTGLMPLDEPTTFLDLAHQVEVLDLRADLNEREQRTIVLVLHDLNLACRYAHHLVAMKDGGIVAEGPPGTVVTAETVEEVFGLACQVIDDPMTGTPLVLPIPAGVRASRGPSRPS